MKSVGKSTRTTAFAYTVGCHKMSTTLFRSFAVAICLSLLLTYLLYFASPGIVIIEIIEILAAASSLAVQHFAVKAHTATFETIVNTEVYTLLLFAISSLYQYFVKRRADRRGGAYDQRPADREGNQ